MPTCKHLIAIEQIGSPIRRHWSQRTTLIALNRIGKVVEPPDMRRCSNSQWRTSAGLGWWHESRPHGLGNYLDGVQAAYIQGSERRDLRVATVGANRVRGQDG